MFTQIDFKKAEGKTIKAMVAMCDDEIAISFTDGTFSVIEAVQSYGDSSEIRTLASFYIAHKRLDTVLEPLFGDAARPMRDAAVAKNERDKMDSKKLQDELRRKKFEELKREFEPDAE